MANVDYDKVFDKFMSTNGSSAIKEIYGMLPALSSDKILILNSLNMIADKYNCEELSLFCLDYVQKCSVNKPLSFLNSFSIKNFLKAYTTDEMLRGIKIQSNINSGGE
jgi:hypothetical protein